jgi:hypothetical protein
VIFGDLEALQDRCYNSKNISAWVGWGLNDAFSKTKRNMPFVNSAEAGKVVKLLLRKETTPLETTAQEFCREFPPAGYYSALCAAINQLQVTVTLVCPTVALGICRFCKAVTIVVGVYRLLRSGLRVSSACM